MPRRAAVAAWCGSTIRLSDYVMSDEPSRELDTNTASRYNRYVLYSKYVIVRKGSHRHVDLFSYLRTDGRRLHDARHQIEGKI
jgi:hypothetical protein